MDSFYTPPRLVAPPVLTIEGDEFRHLSHVMRLGAGDPLRVVDGAGNAYDAVIDDISRTAARCTITAHHPLLNESRRSITLAAGILKNPSRFDYLVEKSVELGVRTIVPLLTERTIPRHDNSERWRKICIAAMKQSGRCVLPTIKPLTPFAEFAAALPPGILRYLAHEQARPGGEAAAMEATGDAVICIGPEGGFSDNEVSTAEQAGFATVLLGPRRLRTETAAVVALATIMRDDARPASFLP